MSISHPPSRLRLPLSLLLGLMVFPLGVITWIVLSGPKRSSYLASSLVRTGGACMLLSALPLLALIAGEVFGLTLPPHPSLIGAGLLFFGGATAGAVLATAGAFIVARQENLFDPS